MPDDDMTHPVVDLSGYITEGQITLDRSIQEKGIYPPIDVLPCLSRLMNKGIGKGKTFPQHRAMADQLYACYARAREVERMRLIVGDDGLTSLEKTYLTFGGMFEKNFLAQGKEGAHPRRLGENRLEMPLRPAGLGLFKLPENYVAENMGREGGRS
ncbi:hypothetical protein MASR2M17_00820 [Aminivibrio sp.]